MLVRAARRKVRNDTFRRLKPSTELYLPWLCPAQLRFQSQSRPSPLDTGYRMVDLVREPVTVPPTRIEGRRNLATAAVEYKADYVPFEGLPPAYNSENRIVDWLHSSDASAIRPFDPSSTIVINQTLEPRPRRYKLLSGVGGELGDIHLTLDACLRVERLERAAIIVQRLSNIYAHESAELRDVHNQYIRAAVGSSIRNRNAESYRAVQKWFEVEMRCKGVQPDATTYALLVKGALQLLREPKMERTVRRYIEFASQSDHQFEVLELPILSDAELYKVTEICPTVFQQADQDIDEISEPPHLSQQVQPATSLEAVEQEIPEVMPVPQKGLGLVALKKSLSLFTGAEVEYPTHLQGTAEERDQAYAYMRQKRLEEDALTSAIDRWREENEHLRKLGRSTALQQKTLGALMWSWHQAMIPLIKQELKDVEEAEMKQKSSTDLERCIYGPFLQFTSPEKLAAATILTAMSSLSTHEVVNGVKISHVLLAIGKAVRDESLVDTLQHNSNNPAFAGKGDSHRRNILQKVMKTRKDTRKTLAGMAYMMNQSAAENRVKRWPADILLKIGAVLGSIMIDAAKIPVVRHHPDTQEEIAQLQPAFFHSYQYVQGKRVGMLRANTFLCDRLRKEPVRDALAKHLPMVVVPKKWSRFDEGGFLSTTSNVMRIKGADVEQRQYAHAAAEKGDFSQVFAGLDVLAKTGWKINKLVFDVMLEAWNSGKPVAKIPPAEITVDYPPEPDASADPYERRKWIHTVKKLENEKNGLHSQRCFNNFQMEIARAFLNETFYFPHNLDFRGRAYPIPPYLNHMGADNCRGLLMFAEGKELGTAGLKWLKIHLANVFGYDKASLRERENFAMEHLEDIYDSATNPLNGKGWWLRAEDPWQCLAACLEIKNALDSEDPTRFKSHLAIHQDGTCNGLQHYAALGGDAWGAKQVNLEPGDRPADVYSAIAKLVEEQTSIDAANGNPVAKYLTGKITRKVVKQTVMTNVYGVTFMGAREQVRKQLREIVPEQSGLEYDSLCTFVVRKIFEALSTMFSGAHDIQYWLGTCASRISTALSPEQLHRIEAERNLVPQPQDAKFRTETPQRMPKMIKVDHSQFKSSVIWTTPLKIPVVQPYRKVKSRVVNTNLQRITLMEPQISDAISKRKQLQAFPPNYIHSLDATHMLLSALKCDEAGLTFAAVHDSFWTHANDVDTMNRVLRESFIQIHSQDLIGHLAAEFKARYNGYMYQTSLRRNTPVAKKIAKWRRHQGSRGRAASKHDELLLECKRLRLLNSDCPEEREEGQKMITPASIYNEGADESALAPPPELAGTALGEIPTRSDTKAKNESMSNIAESLDESLDEPNVEAKEESVGVDADIADDPSCTDEDAMGFEVAPKKKTSEASRYSVTKVWLPLTFPDVPKKGNFDVSRLRESTYFFS